MRNVLKARRIKLTDESGAAGAAWVPTLMLVATACAALLVLIPAEAATASPAPASPAAPAALAAPAARAALPTSAASNADAAARYQQERATCMKGQSNQDRTTCLKEAGAAYAEAKRGGLKVTGSSGGQDARAANATQRCTGLPAEESKACMARMRGEGSTSGTAAGGGILRELVTVEPAASASGAAIK